MGAHRPRRRERRARAPWQHGDRVPFANDDVHEAVGVEVADAEWQGRASERPSGKERPVAAADPDHEIGRKAWLQRSDRGSRDEIGPAVPVEVGRPDVISEIREGA